MGGKNRILLAIVTFFVFSSVFMYQYKITRAGSFGDVAAGQEFQINYSLKKKSRSEWTIDIELFTKNNDELVIKESVISFAKPISREIRSMGEELINHRLEGHVLNDTKLVSESKMEEIIGESFIEITWTSPNGDEKTEKIIF